jgi:hypothetical protein
MSIPHAIENRFAKGESKLQVLGHIGLRTLALLVMGLFQVNLGGGGISAELGISRQVFSILMVTCFFLIWNVYPRRTDAKKWIFTGLQLLGIAGLMYLALIYRNREGLALLYQGDDGWVLQTRWWGILGLIGWAYAICALIYLFISRGNLVYQIIAWTVIVVYSMFGASKSLGFMQGVVPDNGTLQAFTMSGVVLSTMFTKWFSAQKSPTKLILPVLGIGIALIIAAFISRQFWHISKLAATPTWMFLCVGLSIVVYAFFYFLVDIKGQKNWFRIISPAGTATLTCFLIPSYFYAVIQLTGFKFPEMISVYPIGLLKCAAVSLFCIGVTFLIGKIGIKLKI